MTLRIGIVVGEASGDNLAAQLILALKNTFPDIEVTGIIGAELVKVGCEEIFPMERLAVMGFVEPLLRLPELFKMRRWLSRYFLDEPPDLFIGVDAPEFNLGLEKQLRNAGIPVVHYVSPSVWAWRSERVRTIKAAVDLMLTLFPFEEQFYKKSDIPVKFVGHPAADQIPLDINVSAAKTKLGFSSADQIVALLPGSRHGELKHMVKLYLQMAEICAKVYPELKFIMPVNSNEHKCYIDKLYLENARDITLHTVVNKTYTAIAASSIAVVTSGTATLEVMLHKKPMLIAYKTNRITYEIVKRLIKVSHIGLPNLLANRTVVTELIQNDATPEKLSKELLALLNSTTIQQQQIECFAHLHKVLRQNASSQSAKAIIELLGV